MELTKFTHACVRIVDGDHALTIDPGTFSEVETALEGIDAVLITHEHFDHVDTDRLAAAAAGNPALRVWAPKAVVDQLSSVAALEGRSTAVGPGEDFTAGGLRIRTLGGQHALIHSAIPVIANVGYLVEDAIYHPGDSYIVPTTSVELALVPLNAPWAKLSETVDFAVSTRAPRAIGIHDGLLSEIGRGGYGTNLAKLAGDYGVSYSPLAPGEALSL